MRDALRRTTAILVAASGALGLTGCTGSEAFANFGVLQNDGQQTLSIGVNPEDSEQLVVGEIYNQVLAAYGRPVGTAANTNFAQRSAMDTLREDDIDLVVSCTGTLLYDFDRATAETYITDDEEAPQAPNAERADEVYASLVATFPHDIRTVDPSPAQGCADSEAAAAGLPQNLVPLFKEGKLSRQEIKRLNFITRVMSTEDIEEMAERVDDGELVRDATREWLMEYASINPDNPQTQSTDDAKVEPPV